MKEKPTIEELQSFYDTYHEKALIFDKLSDLLNAINGYSMPPALELDTTENLPLNNVLEKLTIQNNELLRKWNNGKYKCKNLRLFKNKYAETTEGNPTKNLILDYLVKEDGKPFKESGIVSTLNSYGVAPERKKTKGRQRKGTHKKDLI